MSSARSQAVRPAKKSQLFMWKPTLKIQYRLQWLKNGILKYKSNKTHIKLTY